MNTGYLRSRPLPNLAIGNHVRHEVTPRVDDFLQWVLCQQVLLCQSVTFIN